MSLAYIKTVTERFISDKRNDLLVLKGAWGIGKTYFWQETIRKAGEDRRIGCPYYAYVSLFGINSLEELKKGILTTRVESSSIKTSGNSKLWITNLKEMLAGAEQIPALREWTGGMASAALFLSLKDTLICFDDIERKGDALDTKDLLGLTSLLKEQRNCKIVFIMNEGTLLEAEKESFRRHSEKIIDLELQFSPSLPEVVGYAFPTSHPHRAFIESSCIKLGIKNIRILQRINRFIEDMLPYIAECEKLVIEDALGTLILFVWSYYDKDKDAPPLSYLMSYSHYDYLLDGYLLKENKKEDTPQVKQWKEILRLYGYVKADEVDKQIAAFIEDGYLNTVNFSAEIAKKNTEARAQQGQDAYRQTWDLYRSSFDDNEKEFVRLLVESCYTNIMQISLRDLQSVVQVLRKLEHDQTANDLIYEYLNQHGKDRDVITAHKTIFLNDIKDEYLLERLGEFWTSAEDTRTIREVVEKLAHSNGWNPEDTELLSKCEVGDYYNFFKSIKSDILYSYVQVCLRFAEIAGTDETYKSIAEKAKQALRRIASECRINRLRVSALFGIEIDDKPTEMQKP